MAFTPNPDATYRIVVRHNRKCLEVEKASTARGAPIVLATPRADAKSQMFKFRKLSPRHYAITCIKSDKNLDVEGGTKENNARLIQWDRSDGEWNEHFRFVYVGEDSYYIIARHSDKCLAVLNGKKEDGAEIVHTRIAWEEYYRFQFLPAEVSADYFLNRDYLIDPVALPRKVILGVIRMAPDVGGALTAVVEYFWPANAEQWMWAQMREYVVAVVRDMIAQEKLKILQDTIAGLGDGLKKYNKEPDDSEYKGSKLAGLITIHEQLKPTFFHLDQPEQTLPYFVAFGTIRLAALRESIVAYERIFRKPDPNRAARLKDLQEEIEQFRQGATRARERALEWRLAMIESHHSQSREARELSRTHKWWVDDKYDNWSQSWLYSKLDGGDANGESLASLAKAERVESIRSSFGAWLDHVLGPAVLWRYLDPSVRDKPKKVEKSFQTGPFGNVREATFRDVSGGKRITRIVVHTSDRVTGIQMYYGGVTPGLRGARGTAVHSIDLEPKESIMGVWGRRGDGLTAIYFQTNRGRSVGGGGAGGEEWVADPLDELNASLAFIGGRKGAKYIDALWFSWKYTVEE